MDESLPEATAVAVSQGRIVAVGDMASLQPWMVGREVTVDQRFADMVLLPGLIDNHIHPFLGAILMPTEHIAPESWRKPDGSSSEAARTPQDYRRLLLERIAAYPDKSDWFVTFGYQQSLHGRMGRAELDALFPDRPVLLIQRSFHETRLNTAAIEKLGIGQADVAGHPQVDLADGHFWETGNKIVLTRMMPYFLRPQWYARGLQMTAQIMQQGGITTAGDMMFGALNPEYEIAMLDQVLQKGAAPLRVVNVFDARGFSNRAAGADMGPPEQPIDFEAGLKAMQPLFERTSEKIWFSKAVKLFADGAMFSQLMQMKPPGYIDGHHGEWLMSPEVLAQGVRTFWKAGWQIHVHVNGDGGMDSVLSALTAAQQEQPRFDHRFFMHHVGFHSSAQTARIATLGAHASVNPYYLYALGDEYARFGLGPERASQITRCGSLLKAGIKLSFHSDFMMAPPQPLLLAWCACARTTLEGKLMAPEERISLMQALRGVTIDAAWALRMEDQIGSIAAGKRADFCALLDDPFELGAQRLKDVRIAGTVFEGEPHMLAQPLASDDASRIAAAGTLGARQPRTAAPRYRPLAGACSASSDVCDIGLQMARWGAAALRQGPGAGIHR
jgi:predicted amidohydrolase YtcJ